MECTQRLECTQELYSTQSDRLYPEQIGFLGICGTKYPVKKGPNKIGRDPQTCSIILNLNSVSRQHAVINILNKKDFMLMDLDSANKTKLSGKTLQAYIPHPLHNGDTVQFGEIFGIFRLIEEEDDLPMTQAIDIPDTPVPTKHMSRINAITTIPESPDVSDRDDSFIVPSQPKCQQFQSSKTLNFIKPGKTISIQPLGTNKIDNIYWNSSKKSTSLNLDDSNTSLNNSEQPVKSNKNANEVDVLDIHEQETQEIFPAQKNNNDSTDTIYTANTQLPELDNAASSIYTTNTQMPDATSPPSIHNMNTQIPCGTGSPSIHTVNTQMPGAFGSQSIYSLETQMPLADNLPDVCKINEQQDMHFDLCANKDNTDIIYNAGTQMVATDETGVPAISSKESHHKPNTSNDEILFDEDDNQPIEGESVSQTIMSEDIDLPINRLIEPGTESESQSQIVTSKCAKRNMRIKSDSSTDCEDIDMLPTQKLSKINNGDDDMTDCEEEIIDLKTAKNMTDVIVSPKPAGNFEDLATQVIVLDEPSVSTNERDVEFEDMPTQVINIDEIEKDAVKEHCNTDLGFEDLPTQVLDEDIRIKKPHVTPQFSNEEEMSPFKVPFNSPLKAKKKDLSKMLIIKPISVKNQVIPCNVDDNRYYQDTQDIYEDLCTQRVDSTEVKLINRVNVKSLHTGNQKPENKLLTNTEEVDVEERVNDFVSNLSSQDVRDVIGVDTQVTKLTKFLSDGSTASDVELTPKKNKPFKFMDIDLPNSQEIKTSVSICSRTIFTESSSESDTENNSEDQCTPILFRKKKNIKPETKLDLTKKFDVETLPSRVITRVRKPTARLQDQEKKKVSENILKPKFLAEQECEIDKEIITENITRLKSKSEKSKTAKNNNYLNKETKQTDFIKESIAESVKNERTCRKKIEKEDSDNLERKQDKAQDSSKDGKRKKRETKNNQKEPLDHKSQVSVTDKSTNQSLASTVDSKYETQTTNIHKKVPLDSKTEASIANKSTKQILVPTAKTKDKTCSSNKNTKETLNSTNDLAITNKIIQQSLDSTIQTNDKTYTSNKNKKIEKVDLRDSPIEIKSTRGARNAKTKDTTTKTEQKSTQESLESHIHTERTIRKCTRKREPKVDNKKEIEKVLPAERKVRRSTRQRTVKEKNEEELVKVPKSISKRSVTVPHEESAVYNLSSGSNSDTSKSLKRPAALDESEAPILKRTRSVVANNVSLRATPARTMKTQYVLFTAFPYEAVKNKLEKVGAVVVTDVMKSTVLLTRQIKRTFKLLCAVGLGKPIVGPDWVQACADTNMVVDPWLYLMKDEAAEKRFRFSLSRTLTGTRNFLKGYNVSSTPSVMPEAHEMRLIVECSGGTWKEGGPHWVCVSIPDDQALWPGLRSRGAILVSTEFILTGVLRQKAEIEITKYK